jgi:hypothetical protein
VDLANDHHTASSHHAGASGAVRPLKPLPAPPNLKASVGTMRGEAALSWGAVKQVESYVVERSPDFSPRVWNQIIITKKSSCIISVLTSGQAYAFRVAAIGPSSQGTWSDEIVIVAT